ncbi:MAG: hypothetical protein NTU73_12300 [Ignavibacteriae bacterium]|nr:hypothetical protein [Ignavibacteriota bacterium]
MVPSSKLIFNTNYYWRVVATNQVGVGSWSSVRSFTTTKPTPVAPTLVSPPNNSFINLVIPILDWDSVSNASSFRLRISIDSSFSSTVIDTSGLNVSCYPVPLGILQDGMRYYWRVNASNSCVSGPWSQTWNFRMVILTSTNSNGSEIPKSFKLYDNYPNPFNPVTKIKFDLPLNDRVILKIYDVTGKEVTKFQRCLFLSN